MPITRNGTLPFQVENAMAAMAAAGHGVESSRIATSDGAANRQAGAALAARLLDGPDRPSAVFCANDALALGFLDAARARIRAD